MKGPTVDIQAAIPSDLGFLGCWSWDASTDTVRTTGELDTLFAVCPDTDGLSMSSYERQIHPDDLEWLRQERPRCFGPSGWGVVEYRMIDREGDIHWVMCRALYETDDDGAIDNAHGMMFDVTALRHEGTTPRIAPAPLSDPVNHVADALISAHRAAVQTDNHQLVFQIEAALVVVGRALAKNLLVFDKQATLDF